MKTNLRPTLWAIFAALAMLIWFKWESANAPQPVVAETATATADGAPQAADDAALPGQQSQSAAIPSSDGQPAATSGLIHVKTDVLEIDIDSVGGSIVESQLLNYSVSIDDPTPIHLFSSVKGKRFHFKTGLNASTHKSNATHQATFHSPKNSYELTGDSLSVPLTWSADGITVTKTFTFYPGRYDFTVEQRIDNASDRLWKGYQYQQLVRDPVVIERGLTTFNTFAGGVYSTPEHKYNKVSFEDLGSNPLDIKAITGGWVGFMEHYFMGAIIPEQTNKDTFFSKKLNNNQYVIGMYGENVSVEQGKAATFTAKGFAGPKINLFRNFYLMSSIGCIRLSPTGVGPSSLLPWASKSSYSHWRQKVLSRWPKCASSSRKWSAYGQITAKTVNWSAKK